MLKVNRENNNMEYIGITRIELDAIGAKYFVSVQRALHYLIAKTGRFYKSNRYCETSLNIVYSIS